MDLIGAGGPEDCVPKPMPGGRPLNEVGLPAPQPAAEQLRLFRERPDRGQGIDGHIGAYPPSGGLVPGPVSMERLEKENLTVPKTSGELLGPGW